MSNKLNNISKIKTIKIVTNIKYKTTDKPVSKTIAKTTDKTIAKTIDKSLEHTVSTSDIENIWKIYDDLKQYVVENEKISGVGNSVNDSVNNKDCNTDVKVDKDVKDDEEDFAEITKLFEKMKSDNVKKEKDKDKQKVLKFNVEVCSACSEMTLVKDDGMIVCTSCGSDNGPIIDYQHEWRNYGASDQKNGPDPNRCGMPVNPLLPKSSIGSIILGNGYESYRKLQRWNSMTYKERSLLRDFNKIYNHTENSGIPNCIIDKAQVLYKMLSDEKITRGTSRRGLIAACLYYSCKDRDISRSPKEIGTLFELNCKKMTGGCKYFLEMMFHENRDYTNKLATCTYTQFVQRYTEKLKFEQKYRDCALYIAEMVDKLGIVIDNTPPSIAVGAIYMVAHAYKIGYTKKKIATVCEISEVTISKTYKKMSPYEDYLKSSFDSQFADALAFASASTT